MLWCTASAAAAVAPKARFEAVEPHMGSMVRIVVYADGVQNAREAMQAAFARIAALDAILSDYKPDSELNRLCQSTSPSKVSGDLFAVLSAALRLAEESDGAFDVTAGPLIRLWREARKSGRLPEPEAIAEAKSRTGWRNLQLDRLTRTVTPLKKGMQLDLGGIAKGYVAQQALETLRARGIRSAMVAASGDIALGDPPPGQRGWKLTLELLGGTREIELANRSVSTAGDSEQLAVIGGVRYSHILDPRSGMALTSRIAVSVVAPQGLDADGLDTAICILGREKGLRLLTRYPNARALIVDAAGTVDQLGI